MLGTIYRCREFYASVLMTAIVMLHVALASISPFRLHCTSAEGCVGSFVRAMDIAGAQTDAGAGGARFRGAADELRSAPAAADPTICRPQLYASLALTARAAPLIPVQTPIEFPRK